MSLSSAGKTAEPSATLALNARAKEMASRGEDVISLSVGEPDFDTPENIKQAAHLAIQAGFTKYTPAAGMKDLRQAVAQKLRADNGLHYEPGQILISNGAKQAIYMTMLCLVEEGDEVLLPAPYWVSYAAQARACGGEVAAVDATATEDLKPTPELLEQAITERSKLLVLNSPCNPSGAVLSREEMAALLEVALEHDLWILADEIYEKLIYDEAVHVSPGSLSEEAAARVVTVNGFSKTYAMTGWRVGYAAGPPELMQAASSLQSNMTSAPNSIAQKAALEALEGPQDSVEDMRDAFATRRRIMVEGLNEVEGVECRMPGGAFYAFADCSGLLGRAFDGRQVNDSMELAEALLEGAGVAAVPGSVFGAEGYLRFHYAASEDTIRRALERLAEFAAG